MASLASSSSCVACAQDTHVPSCYLGMHTCAHALGTSSSRALGHGLSCPGKDKFTEKWTVLENKALVSLVSYGFLKFKRRPRYDLTQRNESLGKILSILVEILWAECPFLLFNISVYLSFYFVSKFLYSGSGSMMERFSKGTPDSKLPASSLTQPHNGGWFM